MKRILIFLFFVLLGCLKLQAQDVPRVISYQGVLVDANGKPIQGTKTLTFKLQERNGAPPISWTETITDVQISGGLFYVPLGLNSTPSGFPTLNGEYELVVSIDGNNQFKVPLYSSISALNIPDGIVTERKIAKDAVTSDKIKDGEVRAEDLSSMGARENQILLRKNNTWQVGDLPSGVPIGTIVAYYGDFLSQKLIDEGWALCDGSNIPNTPEYNEIRALATAAGHPGKYPNLHGYFLRGATKDTLVDPDRNKRTGGSANLKIGSVQQDEFKSHNHTCSEVGGRVDRVGFADGGGPRTVSFRNTTPVIGYTGGSETRPKNVYVNFIIKAR